MSDARQEDGEAGRALLSWSSVTVTVQGEPDCELNCTQPQSSFVHAQTESVFWSHAALQPYSCATPVLGQSALTGLQMHKLPTGGGPENVFHFRLTQERSVSQKKITTDKLQIRSQISKDNCAVDRNIHSLHISVRKQHALQRTQVPKTGSVQSLHKPQPGGYCCCFYYCAPYWAS